MDFKLKLVDDNNLKIINVFLVFFGIPFMVAGASQVFASQLFSSISGAFYQNEIFWFGLLFFGVGCTVSVSGLIGLIRKITLGRRLKKARATSAPYEFYLTDVEESNMRANDVPVLSLTFEGESGIYVVSYTAYPEIFYRYIYNVEETQKPVKFLAYLIENTYYMSGNEIVSKLRKYNSKANPQHKWIR